MPLPIIVGIFSQTGHDHLPDSAITATPIASYNHLLPGPWIGTKVSTLAFCQSWYITSLTQTLWCLPNALRIQCPHLTDKALGWWALGPSPELAHTLSSSSFSSSSVPECCTLPITGPLHKLFRVVTNFDKSTCGGVGITLPSSSPSFLLLSFQLNIVSSGKTSWLSRTGQVPTVSGPYYTVCFSCRQ